MTQVGPDEVECDGCGRDVTPGSIVLALVVSDVAEDGHVRNYHFCREPRKGAESGCAGILIQPRNLKAYTERVEAEKKAEQAEEA